MDIFLEIEEANSMAAYKAEILFSYPDFLSANIMR